VEVVAQHGTEREYDAVLLVEVDIFGFMLQTVGGSICGPIPNHLWIVAGSHQDLTHRATLVQTE